ncbi:tetratricopeptide repeat protein [Candidatus Thiodictyon syntrophicum]|jgi:putative PEP-CTERM system TPR-repeat lipoprotein|uniref:Uncharacterized protein n=1 Tax=Candidatus Thiodictyon syntrophicum TaxID=1166950 RepID=A0A2K8UEC3_9GAMM|nr:tetratricopeptide repeat protein [Candidatus Thiodictyon syntrophicum]AUB83934.1 hypothetical protein THSYN_25380 [Candidatus Thiodictyon syntrophicum]
MAITGSPLTALLSAALFGLGFSVSALAAPTPELAAPAPQATLLQDQAQQEDEQDFNSPLTSAALLARVRGDLAVGQVRAAIAGLRLLLHQDPANLQGLLILADLHLLIQRGAVAETALKQAEQAGVPRAQVLTRLAEAYLQQNDPRRVLDELADLADLEPDLSAQMLAWQARAQVALGDRAQARALLERALTLVPDQPLVLTDLGRLTLLEGRRDEARATLDRVITLGRDTREAHAILAELDQAQGQPGAAERHLDAALEQAPERWLYRWRRAMVRIDLDKLAAADADLQAAAAVSPGFAGLDLARARLALAQENPAAAMQHIDAYLAVVPKDQAAFQVALQAAAGLGDPARLRSLAERLQRAAPDSPGPVMITAQARLIAGDAQGALDTLEPLARREVPAPELTLLRARALRALGRRDEAGEVVVRALERFPQDPRLRLWEAESLADRGEREAALRGVNAILANKPQDIPARMLRGRLLVEMGVLDEASREGRSLMDAVPGAPGGYRIVAAALVLAGDAQGARAVLSEALGRVRPQADLLVGLARLEVAAGDLSPALEHYRAALALEPDNLEAMAGLARHAADGEGGLDMLERLAQALQRDQDNPVLRAETIAALLARGQSKEAARVADETPIDLRRDAPEALGRARALALLAAERPGDALGVLGPLTSANPRQAEPRLLSARALAALKDQRAQEQFLAGWRLDPDAPLAAEVLDDLLAILPEGRARERLITEMSRVHPNALLVEVLRARVASAAGALAQAARHWKEVRRREPKHRRWLLEYLRTLLALDQRAEAIVTADAWLRESPKDAEVAVLLANHLFERGERGRAARYYQDVLAYQPDNPFALNNLALDFMGTKPAAAVTYAQRLLSLFPAQPKVLDTVGTVRLAVGDGTGAVEVLSRAHDKAPSDPQIAFHLAQALVAAAAPGRARELLRPIVSQDFAEQGQARDLLARLEAGAPGN